MASELAIRSCDTGKQILFWHLSIDHNMDVYYHVKNRLRAPTLARKLDISHFTRSIGHVINKISRIDRLPNFLRYGLRSGARTWSSAINYLINYSYIHTSFYYNSLKGLFSYRTIRQENCTKKESITVIHKNNNYKIKIINEIKLAISNPVLDWKEVVWQVAS